MPVSRHFFPALAACALVMVTACRRAPATVAGPLPQRGYVWQREWTPAVTRAVEEAGGHLAGVVLLGAELEINGAQIHTARPKIDWAGMRAAGVKVAIALRVAPTSSQFSTGSAEEKALHELVQSLLAQARAAGVQPAELQLDYDAPQKKLAIYRGWLHRLRAALPGERLVITTLPAWLEEKEFPALLAETDGYVLQVHSVPARAAGGREVLCEPALARGWVARAARLGRPFTVALPTYSCLAGYGADGRLLGVAMEGARPAWPAGTRTFELRSDADALSALVHEWEQARPPQLQALIWYRVPVSTDARNWRWPTFAAVLAGRAPRHQLEALTDGENPVEIALRNAGEVDEAMTGSITVTAGTARPTAFDALGGWAAQQKETRVVFQPAEGYRERLRVGEQRRIGWVRYEGSAVARAALVPSPR